jgi:hypothetical protein
MLSVILQNNKLPNNIEKYILKSLNFKPPGSYSRMSDSEILHIQQKIKDKYNWNIIQNIIVCIKTQYMQSYIVQNHYKIKSHFYQIYQLYEQMTNIIELCTKYDLSPMTILRPILEKKYKTKFTHLLSEPKMLTPFDISQIDIATKSDTFNQIDQTQSALASANFELDIEDKLKSAKINYQTQADLTIEQKIIFGKAVNTPDFYIRSDLMINNIKINWIDAKNFYGANVQFLKKKINKQIQKYIQKYGSGCIIFKYGANEKINFDNVLVIGFDDFIL